MIPNNGSALETKPANWKTINWKQVERSSKIISITYCKGNNFCILPGG